MLLNIHTSILARGYRIDIPFYTKCAAACRYDANGGHNSIAENIHFTFDTSWNKCILNLSLK